MSDKPRTIFKGPSFHPIGLIMGIALGVGVWLRVDNFALAVTIGSAFAIIVGASLPRIKRNKPHNS